jgi:hypothetical protein
MSRVYNITGIEKNGLIVTVTIEGKANPVIFDMAHLSFTSYTGRDIQRFPVGSYCFSQDSFSSIIPKLLFNALLSNSKGEVRSNLSKVELFINNPEILGTIRYCSELADECPKGFIKWLKDNGKKPTKKNLTDYKRTMALKRMTQEDKEVYELLFGTENSPYYQYSETYKECYFSMSSELRHKFNKILKASIKSLSWRLKDEMTTFIDRFIRNIGWSNWCDERRPNNWEKLLNTDRSFQWNTDNIVASAKKAWEDKIIKNENKIRAIEELSDETFVVVVPKTLQDFTDEGNMQHNCVGHFYHGSIAKGENLIYFIRKKSTPNHSYITNRYNVRNERTVETRMFANAYNKDEEARELIKEIDKKITSLLSE